MIAEFLSGPGVNTLPQVIFGYARRGINPTIYAAATLLIVSVTLVVVGYSVWVARQTRRREREIAAATRAELAALQAPSNIFDALHCWVRKRSLSSR